MEHLIFIREAITGSEIARFFEKLHSYHRRDIFPEIEQAEDLAYFLSDEYLSQLKTLHRQQENRLFYDAGHLWFRGRQVLHHGVLRLPGISWKQYRSRLR